MFIAIVLLLGIKSLFATTICNLPDASPVVVDASILTACLKTIPKDATELENLVGTVIEYVKNSPYPLLFMGGANNLQPFDILEELGTLKTQAATWAETVLEFYEKIHDIIGKLKDPHATLRFPFLTSFAYLLPFGYAPVSGDENSLKLTRNDATDTYILMGGDNETDFIINEMDFKDGGSTFKPATVAFSDFALEVGCAGHDPHALFNDVLKKGNIFSAIELFRPDEKYNANLYLKGTDKNGVLKEISIPWLGFFTGDTVPEDFDELNPVVDAPAPGRSRNSEKHMDRDSIKRLLPRMLDNQFPPIFVERKRMMKEIKRQLGVVSDFSANSGKHESRLITSMYERMLATRKSKFSPSRSRFLSPLDAGMLPTILPEAINLVQLYKYVDGDDENACIIYADKANKLGYIRYTSFMQSDGEETALRAFIEGFGKGFRKMVDEGVTDVIFDVRGNGGGLTLLVAEFTDFFFHNTIYPADLDTDILLGNETVAAGGNYLEAAIQALNGPVPYYKVVDGVEKPLDSILDPIVPKSHNYKVDGANSQFTTGYTQRGFLKARLNTTIRGAYGGYSPFDPQHFYIVSDAVCASCCGIFTKLAVESKAARVLGYGVNPTKKDDLSTYVPGNCAGSLYATDQVETYRTALEGLTAADLDGTGLPPIADILAMLPPKFDRKDVSFGVTDYEFFSRNPAHSDQTLYMVQTPVADVLPIQVSSDPETDAVLKEIAAVTKNLYIDNAAYCVTGEVVVNSACQTDERTAAHQLWGKTCDRAAGLFTGPCAFSHCDTGYQLSGVQTCAPVPEEAGDSATVVSVRALLLALVFAILMVWY